jgi:hypothetical protein
MATSLTTDEDDPCKFYAIALYDYEPLEKDQLAPHRRQPPRRR